MTQREKAKRYDEIIGKAKKELDVCGSQDCDAAKQIFRLFPELCESEEERIRKEIIKTVELYGPKTGDPKVYNDMLVWLEKQGEPTKINPSEFDSQLNRLLRQFESLPKEELASSLSFYLNVIQNDGAYKQKPTEKAEPKFKVGDWILYSGDHYEGVRHITKIDKNGYYIERNGLPHGIIPFNHEICMRLWTIQDAKDGDVLASELCGTIMLYKGIRDNNIQFYCDYDYSDIDVPGDRFAINNGQHYGSVDDSDDWHPATAEQRQLLFDKMHEASYEWDANKKELSKCVIDEGKSEIDYCFTKMMNGEKVGPAWSEDDEKMIEAALQFAHEYGRHGLWCWLKSLKERALLQQKQVWSKEDEKTLRNICAWVKDYPRIADFGEEMYKVASNYFNWLKSLKPQNQLKTSEEQDESYLGRLDDSYNTYHK